jgi:uncharacterized protein
MTVQSIDSTAFAQEWTEWHRQHEAALAAPHGFLAITGLHWLSEAHERFPDVPGAWSTGPAGITVELAEDEELVVDGDPIRGPSSHSFGVIPERGSVTAAAGDLVVEVAKRGGHDIIRPRHPGNPLRAAFPGVPAYPPDPDWVITGRYVPFDVPRAVTVGSVVDGLQHVYTSPGRVEFSAAGQHLALTAFNGMAAGTLFFLFTDATSGVTTYAANRALAADAPGSDGTVKLDFNRATNLPCAYTQFATCPLPPAENRLPIAVEAGEQFRYGSSDSHAR